MWFVTTTRKKKGQRIMAMSQTSPLVRDRKGAGSKRGNGSLIEAAYDSSDDGG